MYILYERLADKSAKTIFLLNFARLLRQQGLIKSATSNPLKGPQTGNIEGYKSPKTIMVANLFVKGS